jgi:hypothetical protein
LPGVSKMAYSVFFSLDLFSSRVRT